MRLYNITPDKTEEATKISIHRLSKDPSSITYPYSLYKRVKLLVFSVLLGLVVAAPSTTCTKKGWTLACQVYEWEETNNKQEPKHPFPKLNEDYFKKKCPAADKCTNDCDLKAQDIEDALLEPSYTGPIKCDLTKSCATTGPKNCLAEIEVSVLENEQSAPDVTTGTGGTKKKRKSPEETTRVRRETKIVKRKTLILPVRTLSMDPDTFTRLEKEYTLCSTTTPQRDAVFCLVTEPELGVAAKADESLDVWKYTGLPYDVVTDPHVTNLLGGRVDTQSSTNCAKYGPTINCRPLPVCYGNTLAANCEQICGIETMSSKGKPTQCRILDVDGYPLERQGYPPHATWMTEAQNLDNKIFKINETAAPLPPPAAPGTPALPAYARPLNMWSVSEETYRNIIRKNYWLNYRKNPFFLKYPEIGLVQVPKCSSNDHLKAFLDKVYSDHPENRPEFCDSDALVNSGNLMLYAMIGIGMVLLLVICIIVMVVAFICWRKKKAAANQQSGEQKNGGDGTTSKSGAVDGGTSPAGAV